MQTMFEQMGLSPEAAKLIVNDQAINTIPILGCLDDAEIQNLAQVCCKPGGYVKKQATSWLRNKIMESPLLLIMKPTSSY